VIKFVLLHTLNVFISTAFSRTNGTLASSCIYIWY